jgi:Zn-dependent protease with chaperone function
MRRVGQGLALIALALVAAGCATAARPRPEPVKVRPANTEETRKIARAIIPLLIALDYPFERTPEGFRMKEGCRVSLGILVTSRINAAVAPGQSSPCVHFRLLVTETALAALPERELRAIMAHELGHVHLGHFARAEDRKQIQENWQKGVRAVGEAAAHVPILGLPALVALMGVNAVAGAGTEVAIRSFKREDEAEAEQFAAALLRRVAGRQALPACLGLAELFERLGADGQTRSAEWLSTHPSPGRRAETIRNECERAAAAQPAKPRMEIPAAGYRLTPQAPAPARETLSPDCFKPGAKDCPPAR